MQVLPIQPELLLSRAKLRRDENRLDEFDDIVGLLTDYWSDNSEETGNLILFIADACMGENHLWQDMGLASREVLSSLMQCHFPDLFAKNTGNMKWKKFFYKQLCERAEIMICKSPSCGVCVDYQICFGAEDAER
ncbi:MAG TPA: nitrogen fixation protein NifQ [Methylophilaceae bacterium]|jgi:nitrogen fixation protein NifQ